MYDRILVRYGELTLKGKNRRTFIKKTNSIIQNRLHNLGVKLERNHDRLYIELNDVDHAVVIERLQTVFGLHSFSYVHKCENDIDQIKQLALEIMKLEDTKPITFKVDTKRANKRFPIRSMDITKQVAGHVLTNTNNITVDVHNPDVELKLEVRNDGSFLFTNRIKALGGFPVGIEGKGILMLSGGIDSPVAGYLTMKRGVEVEAIHFESPPHTSVDAKYKVFDLAEKLSVFTPNQKIKVHVVPFTKLQEELFKNVEPSYTMTIMRRMMYRIAEAIAKQRKALIISNGESIGQVASQTLHSMMAINDVVRLPVIPPLGTMDKDEIVEISKRIDTFETSIKPFEDCCTIFVPKHPTTKPTIERCEWNESKFDWESLLNEAVEQTETVMIKSGVKDYMNNNEFDELL